jgi:hypothetical protein
MLTSMDDALNDAPSCPLYYRGASTISMNNAGCIKSNLLQGGAHATGEQGRRALEFSIGFTQ